MSRTRPLHFSLSLLAAGLVLLVAALAGGSLWILRRLHNQAAHASAARAVLTQGQLIALNLALQPAVRDRDPDVKSWEDFSRLAQALRRLENGLEFVAVERNGVTVFQEHMVALDGRATPGDWEILAQGGAPMEIERRLVLVGGTNIPVVTFSIAITNTLGETERVRVGLRREAIEQEEVPTVGAIHSMFRLSLVAVALSFGVCLVLVLWLLHREQRRERSRRQEEHLAFSGVLANGIVHDFRNPMSALRLDAQMLEKEAQKGGAARLERIAELAGRVRATLDRMEKILQEFLYLSRPREEQPERLNLGVLVRECMDMLAPRFETAGVQTVLKVEDQPLEIMGSASALRRSLVNVLVNAEHFAGRGGQVRVRVYAQGRKVVLDIADTGPGVPPEARGKIFEMFYSTRPQGTGLGLFLARTALEQCGGGIRVVDHNEKGACFRITLPQAPAQKENTHG